MPSNTTTLSLEFSGGWRQRIPFNFTLSDPEGGVRGYSRRRTRREGSASSPGSTIDSSWGVRTELADLGFGAFADAGRLWAGDIPYGVNTLDCARRSA